MRSNTIVSKEGVLEHGETTVVLGWDNHSQAQTHVWLTLERFLGQGFNTRPCAESICTQPLRSPGLRNATPSGCKSCPRT